MGAGFERQLAQIKDKAKLHQLIDELPENAMALVIVEHADPQDGEYSRYRFTAFGDVSVRDALWLAESARSYFMDWARRDD